MVAKKPERRDNFKKKDTKFVNNSMESLLS
jgi:hypothetical protein